MISPIMGGAASTAIVANATRYINLFISPSQGGGANSLLNRDVAPSAGTLSNFFIELPTAPGAGQSITFTIVKNGIDTSLALTISDTNTTGSDTTHQVVYAAGDIFFLKTVSSVTAAASALELFIENSSTGQWLGFSTSAQLSNSAARYAGLMNGLYRAAAMNNLIPTAGTISSLYLNGDTAPGAGTSYTTTLVVNGTDTALVASVSGTNTTGNNTVNSVAVNAGDTAYWRMDPAGTPAAMRQGIGALFTPTIDGESIQVGSSTASLAADTTDQFTRIAWYAATYSTDETIRSNYAGTAFTVKKLYVNLGTAPGVTMNRAITIRSNNASTAVTTTIADTATTGNDTTNSAGLAVPGSLSMLIKGGGVGVPAASTAQWGFVTYTNRIAESGPLPNNYQFVEVGDGMSASERIR